MEVSLKTTSRWDTPKWIGTDKEFQLLHLMLKATIVMNMLDGIFTLYWVHSGIATEANPLLAEIVYHPLVFVGIKWSLVGLGSILLWKRHKTPLAVIGIVLMFTLYYSIVAYHLHAVDLSFLL